MIRNHLLLIFLFFSFLSVFAQPERSKKLSVFIDCSGINCDENFIRSEIKIVDFLSDRLTADLHILITAFVTGNGTEKFQLVTYGQNAFKGYIDTLLFTTRVNGSGAEKREQLVHFIKLSLAPILAKTPFAESFSFDMKSDSGKLVSVATKDPWNYVVISIGGDGEYNADQNYKSARAGGNLFLNRTTDKSRFGVGGYASKHYSVYKYEDTAGTKKYEVNNSDYGVSHYLVLSLGRHYSFGYLTRYSNNTFSNFESKFYINPVIELSLFPYTDINNRSFLIRYGVDMTSYKYIDTTIYNKTNEVLFGHEASASINFNQKWGSFSSGVYYRNYFNDPSLNSMGINLSFNIRLIGGLSFYASVSGNIVHDQVYLPKGGATEQEVLIRKRQLKSTFNFYSSGGLNFRFGSKLNNFVNPRIGGFRGF